MDHSSPNHAALSAEATLPLLPASDGNLTGTVQPAMPVQMLHESNIAFMQQKPGCVVHLTQLTPTMQSCPACSHRSQVIVYLISSLAMAKIG